MERWRRAVFAGAAGLGGVLAVIVSIPGSWYGIPETDSYVFTPPPPDPLWFTRDVVPILTIAASLGLLLAVGGLITRDYRVAGKWRRAGSVGTLVGLLGTTVVAALFAYSSPSEIGGAVTILVAFGGLLVSALVLVVSLVALGVGYLKANRTRLGAVLIGVVVAVAVLWFASPASLGPLPAGLVVAVAGIAVAVDLWTHPDPVEAPSGRDAPAADRRRNRPRD